MRWGFTGTRIGMTRAQKDTLEWMIGNVKITEWHHGRCLGADVESHTLVRRVKPGTKIIGHPAIYKKLDATCQCDEVMPETDYLTRNKNIVKAVEQMVAAPKEMEEQRRGGTWFTVRYAKQCNVSCMIIYPDGGTELRDAEASDGPQR